MPYKFTFDISKVSQHFFIELAIIGNQMGMQKVFSKTLQVLIEKFRIQEVSGLDIQDAVVLIQDLLQMQTLNLVQKQKFQKTKKKDAVTSSLLQEIHGYSMPSRFRAELTLLCLCTLLTRLLCQQGGPHCQRKRLRRLRFIWGLLSA
jgi:hypothetical protein